MPHLDVVARAIGRSDLAPDDDFFAVGGHSLAIMRLIALVRDTMGAVIDVRGIFRARTVGAIAELIGSAPLIATEKEEGLLSDDHGRLGPLELAIYLDDQLVEGESPYIIRETWALEATLDRNRLRNAVTVLLARHPILRSHVVLHNGALTWKMRSVAEAAAQVMPSQVRTCSASAGDSWVGLRLSLVDEGRGQRLKLNAHHAMLDGRGLSRLVAELAKAYEASQHDAGNVVETRLPPAPVSDARLVRAWRNRLAGIGRPPRPEPDVVSPDEASAAAVHAICLTTVGIEDLSTAELAGAGPVAVMAAIVAAWMHRMTGADDLLLFTAAATDLEVSGLRVSTTVLPLRSRLKRDISFSSLLAAHEEMLAWALDHRLVDLQALTRILRDEAGCRAGVPVLLDLEDRRSEQLLNFAGVRAERLELEPETVRADIEITLRVERSGRIAFALRGRRGLYTQEALEAWAESLATVTEIVVAAPATRVHAVPLVRPTSSVAAVRNGKPVASGASVPVMLREALKRRGETIVAVDCSSSRTGRWLLHVADAVSRRLASLGAVSGTPVYCELRRSILYPCVLLGIWQIGAVPVLVNPEHPPARRQAMRRRLPPFATIRYTTDGCEETVVTLEGLLTEAEAAVSGRFLDPAQQGKVAYVAFTSGSTGEPKPVACSWSGLSQLLAWSRRHVPMCENDAFLHTAAPGFDISLWEMLHPLLNEARLVVAGQEGLGDATKLIELCNAHCCTHVHFVPSLLEAFLNALQPGEARALKLILCGGDMTPRALHVRLLETLHLPMQHCYGPTEAAIFVLSWYGDRPSPWPERLPLGDPIDGAGVAVIDPTGAPVVKGAVGELAIFGEALARGYLGMGGETAARFRPLGGLGTPGSRLYLTGDRVRMLPDGTLEYRGRSDQQVKIAGIRIELGEVEAAIANAAGVARVAVVHQRNGERDQLIAYVQAAPGSHSDAVAISRFVKEAARARLPAAATPHRVILLDSLPLGLTGKVDRAALPQPGEVTDDGPSSVPDESISGVLIQLWRDALGGVPVELDDDFFGLGGDSMTAIRMAAAARRYGLRLRLADVLRNPTVRQLSEVLNADDIRPSTVAAPGTPLVLGEAARRWLAVRDSLNGEGVQSLLLRAPCRLDRHRLGLAWHEVLRRRDALSIVVRREGNSWHAYAGLPPGSAMPFVAKDRQAAAIAAREAVSPEEGVMAAVALVESDLDVMAVAIHHLSADWQSWGLVLGDLWDAYSVARTTDPAPPRSPSPSFAAWALANETNGLEPVGRLKSRRPGSPRHIARRVLDGTSAAVVAGAGEHRTALLLASAGEAIAAILTGIPVPIELEVDARASCGDHPIDAAGTVGWLAAYRPLNLTPAGPDPSDWLAAAQRALAAYSTSASSVRPDCVLNIVPSQLHHASTLVPVGPTDQDMTPVHPVAIEVELDEDEMDKCGGTLVVDCDDQVPAGTAEALADAMFRALLQHAASPQRVRATPLQVAMLLAALRRPDDRLYHTQIVFSLDGQVDAKLLRESWTLAAQTHDAFRCRFEPYSEGGPVLVIDATPKLSWTVWPCDNVEEACDDALRSDLARPFDVTRGPLSRLILVSSSNGARLIWSHHHVLFDGWSLNLVVRTVARAYSALRSGDKPPPSAPSIAVFSEWWRKRDVDVSVAYWVTKLRTATPPRALTMGSRRAHSGAASGGDTIRLSLPADVTLGLGAFGAKYNATLHEVMLAAWSLVLARQTQVRDVTFGIVVALRPPELPRVEDTVGLLMNTVPFHIAIGDDLEHLLANARDALADAVDHADAPLARVLGQLRDHGWVDGFDSLLVFENYPGDRSGAELADVGRLTVLDACERSETPFILVVLPGNELRFELLHANGADKPNTAFRLCSQFEHILRSFAALVKTEMVE